jgi:hypothetical protein
MTAHLVGISQAAEFHALAPGSVRLPLPPRFTFGTFPADIAAHYYDAMNLPADGVYAGAGFVVSDFFVMDREARLLYGGEINLHPFRFNDMTAARQAAIAAAPRRRVPGAAALLFPPGNGRLMYGHWMVDALPRLALLEQAGHNLANLWYPVPNDIPRFVFTLLKLFGVPENRLVGCAPGDVLEPDTVLIPTAMHNGVRFSTMLPESVALFRRAMTRAGAMLVAQNAPPRIYLARTGANRQLLNRESIEAMALAAGFVIVHAEQMPLPQQFALFSEAREITGEYGAAFHNTIFSPPGAVVCALRGSETHPAFIQSGIGEVLGQPTGYVFGKSVSVPGPHDYTIREQDFADCLRCVFGSKADVSLTQSPPNRRVAAEQQLERPARRGSLLGDLLRKER